MTIPFVLTYSFEAVLKDGLSCPYFKIHDPMSWKSQNCLI